MKAVYKCQVSIIEIPVLKSDFQISKTGHIIEFCYNAIIAYFFKTLSGGLFYVLEE
jgi:hypothetical protein